MIREELELMAAAFFNGAVMWGIYDIIRIKRRVFTTGIILSVTEDIIYSIILAFTIFRIIYIYNSGYVRIFALVATYMGMGLFEIFAGKFIVEYGSRLLNIIRINIMKVLKRLTKSIRKVIKLLRRFLPQR